MICKTQDKYRLNVKYGNHWCSMYCIGIKWFSIRDYIVNRLLKMYFDIKFPLSVWNWQWYKKNSPLFYHFVITVPLKCFHLFMTDESFLSVAKTANTMQNCFAWVATTKHIIMEVNKQGKWMFKPNNTCVKW